LGHRGYFSLLSSRKRCENNPRCLFYRIHQATKYIPLDRLSLSPQCGFASCAIGNKLTPDEQWAKLQLVKEIADEVWK